MQFKSVSVPSAFRPRQLSVKSMDVHAYGLLHPGHMEFTADGRLLVSEFGRGRVVDITSGGDFRDAKSLISGLQHPAAIITNFDSEILVIDTGSDSVRSVSSNLTTLAAQPFAAGIPAPYGAVVYRDKLLVTYNSYEDNGLVEASKQSLYAEDKRYVWGFPIGVSEYPYVLSRSAGCGHWTGVVAADKLIFSQTTFGILWNVSNPGEFNLQIHKRFAWGLNKPVGMIYNENFDLLFVAESGSGTVKCIPSEGGMDMRYVPPLVTGLKEPRCVRFAPNSNTMFVCDMSACCVWRIEFE